MSEPKTKADFSIDLREYIVLALTGGLIGFGWHGTLQAAALGAGIGLAAPLIVLIVLLLYSM